MKNIVFTVSLILTINLLACGQCNSLVEGLPEYDSSSTLSSLPIEKRISADDHNNAFLNYSEEFFYSINGKKSSDGVAGRRRDSVTVSSLDDDFNETEITYYNQFFVIGLLNILDEYCSIIVMEESPEAKNINLYNLDDNGKLLSAIRLFQYAKGVDNTIIHQRIKTTINEENILHQRTEADFIIDRKFILDPDGHFRVIEEEIKDFK